MHRKYDARALYPDVVLFPLIKLVTIYYHKMKILKQMNEMAFTWIPFYKELAQKLLKFRNNRAPLVDWIYNNLQGHIQRKVEFIGHCFIQWKVCTI